MNNHSNPQPGWNAPQGPAQPGWNDPEGPTQPVQPTRSQAQPSLPPEIPPVFPDDPLSHYQAIPYQRPKRPGLKFNSGCGCLAVMLFSLLVLGVAYLIFPSNDRILLLGIDRAPDGTAVSRSDTIILLQVNPLRPDVKMLSIPRDLWVSIPGVGENRINTAHFFAEANHTGSGPQATIDTIAQNFGIRPAFYARIQFDGFKDVIDAMGGLDLTLDQPQGGLPAGKHHLTGEQALAFARDRKGTDDFFRMTQGQLVVLTAARQLLNPTSLVRLPVVLATARQVIDTDIPIWEWPRIGLALVRAGPKGVDHRTLTREMALPFVTGGGAQVLAPQWNLIRPFIADMFGN
jgi:polyisoprenyl-teichoic acid--peptidoglycan teichoic acid transferase